MGLMADERLLRFVLPALAAALIAPLPQAASAAESPPESVWRDAGYTPYRRGYCPVAEQLMPRLVFITISSQSYDFHQQNAAALDRALRRLE